MWWRLPRREWVAGKGAGNKRSLRKLVQGGTAPGIIAYANGQPAGWVALAPREEYVRLASSRTLKPIDARPVWSVSCFFIARPHRGRGLMTALIEAAADFARKRGARLLEGYPSNPKKKTSDVFLYTGTLGAFARASFEVAARPSKAALIVRRSLQRPSKAASSS
jgi:GNAT superfamily N-acetyltransferase